MASIAYAATDVAFRILVGDAREKLRELPDNSVHCCITSPPYWGLRAYLGDPGMIGLEPTFDAHLANLLAVFREVRRVLRDDGTLWLNYGDAYAGGGRARGKGGRGSSSDKQTTNAGSYFEGPADDKRFKPKDLMMMPARVAMALQADGWWLRSEVVWHKPNPMPESVTDRPTGAHEKIYLLTKQPRYFYDAVAVRTAVAREYHAETNDRAYWEGTAKYQAIGHATHGFRRGSEELGGANLRNVWRVPTYSFKGAHFATFPPRLIEPCIKAGTSERGCCPGCGAPWVRVTASTTRFESGSGRAGRTPGGKFAGTKQAETGAYDIRMGPVKSTATLRWEPSCSCEAGKPIPATVLDPFGGAGTVGLVADNLGRDSVLVEISAEYAAASETRIRLGHDRADPTAEPQPKWSTLEGWAEQQDTQ